MHPAPPRRVASSSTPKPSSSSNTTSPGPSTPSKSKVNTKSTGKTPTTSTTTTTTTTTNPAQTTPSAITPKRPSSSSTSSSSSSSLANSATNLWNSYNQNTSPKLKLLDGFQLFLMLSGIAQFLYCLVITTFPFNAFISGFAATVGQFVLTAALRAQVNPKNKTIFPTISPERAFADYVFGSASLHFFVYNYLG